MKNRFDFVIVGGGIIGSAIARELAFRKAGSVLVLEKEISFGEHASGRNSGVIHSGINQKPGSLKAKMCLEGNQRLREFCLAKKVPMNPCGTLVAARNEAEIAVLEKLKKMGAECDVQGLQILSEREFKIKEPSAVGIAALFSPNGATVDSMRLLQAVIEEAIGAGVEFKKDAEVKKINFPDVLVGDEHIIAKHLINCAGLQADRIAHLMGYAKNLKIIPFRGEYMEVKNCDVRSMIYQPPDLRFPFLSIHLTREADGKVLAGPSAVLAFGREAYNKELHWKDSLDTFLSPQFLKLAFHKPFRQMAFQNAKTCLSKKAFLRQIQSIVPSVKLEDIHPYRAGIRAQVVDSNGAMIDDLLVQYYKESTHVLNAVSPGMTSSLPFAQMVVDKILS